MGMWGYVNWHTFMTTGLKYDITTCTYFLHSSLLSSPPPPPPTYQFFYAPFPSSGHPSVQQVALRLTPTAGSLRVQLTTKCPGTRESIPQYSISTSTSPCSRRQTGQQTLPVTNLTTPVSGSEKVALDPGTYSVTVTVTNQHGDTTSVPQEVTVPTWCLQLH